MSRHKLRVHNTPSDNLCANLRGEVGEIVFTWVLMRNLMAEATQLRTSDPANDISNPQLSTLSILIDKLSDDVVARLSELGECKIGRLNFYFAGKKLAQLGSEITDYRKFVESNGLHRKRNYDISHKELPERWSDHKHMRIPYKTLLKAMARALRLMKRIDRVALGPSAPYLWAEMRKRRYSPIHPIRAGYMLLPHLYLPGRERSKIILEEIAQGQDSWVDMHTTVDGVEVTISANKKWGAVLLGDRMFLLPHYPLQELKSISTQPDKPFGHSGDA